MLGRALPNHAGPPSQRATIRALESRADRSPLALGMRCTAMRSLAKHSPEAHSPSAAPKRARTLPSRGPTEVGTRCSLECTGLPREARPCPADPRRAARRPQHPHAGAQVAERPKSLPPLRCAGMRSVAQHRYGAPDSAQPSRSSSSRTEHSHAHTHVKRPRVAGRTFTVLAPSPTRRLLRSPTVRCWEWNKL